jgi:hypothetical protein
MLRMPGWFGWGRAGFWGMAALLAAAVPLASSKMHGAGGRETAQGVRFDFSYPGEHLGKPLDGRLFLLVSTEENPEPRFAVSDQPETQQMFAVDVDRWSAGEAKSIDESAIGYPMDSIARIPAGDYYVQGLLNVYETFHLADGRTLKLPMDFGEGQQWNRKPGNLVSRPQRVYIDPSHGGVVKIELSGKIPPVGPDEDSKYVKYISMRSEMLSRFWGRPMELGAIVVLPEGWDSHPNAHYPLMVWQGHFPSEYRMRSEPPTPDMQGRERLVAQHAYQLYQQWSEGKLPRMIVLEIRHANPYYDDSYAVNSENVGPYGDAITKELIPFVEKKFRGIGQGWARTVMGGSTGGWEALASQVFYPDFYNGAWCMCPDPVDFRGYQIANIYDDPNALWLEGPWSQISRPAVRSVDDQVITTMDRENRREYVLGTHGRSTEQFGIWQAVFSPVGDDGYPKPIWDYQTGVIDHKVAAYWREHYDLRYILERNWEVLGPKVAGKIHVKVGTRDTYYLDNAVRLLQKSLESMKNPAYGGDFEYGPYLPHCFTGDPSVPVSVSSQTFLQRILPQAADWITKTAPSGADMSWKY